MIHLLAAAGRFNASTLTAAAQALAKDRPDAWGIAFCHGSRLEWLHSHPAPTPELAEAPSPGSDADYVALADLRTDMAMLAIHSGSRTLSRREVQPFARREPLQSLAFCNLGRIAHPELLDPGPRAAESADPGEKLFLHLANRLDPEKPVESCESILADMKDETGVCFTLMCPDWLLVGLKQTTAEPAPLWKGRGDLLLVLASQPVSDISGVGNWAPLSGNTVMAVTRQPRELL
ncbi:MAG: hypothetical protein ABIK37_00530 [candidate division WOR-3 bacterium]